MSESEESTAFPAQGRLLGLDYGTKRLGIAVCDPGQSIASPITNHDRQGPQHDGRVLKKTVEEYRIKGIVIGLPVHISGQESAKSQEARKFGQWIIELTGLPVTYWDERYTSTIAEALLLSQELSKKKRKARMDKLAAQLMLQSFLDAPDRKLPPIDMSEEK